MKNRKRIRRLKKRIAALEAPATLPPEPTIPTVTVDPAAIWRDHVADYAHGWDDAEDWNLRGYL